MSGSPPRNGRTPGAGCTYRNAFRTTQALSPLSHRQFRRQLQEIRFLDPALGEEKGETGTEREVEPPTPDLSEEDTVLLQCLLCGALWPNIATLATEPGTKRRQLTSEQAICLIVETSILNQTLVQGDASFHPGSVCFKREGALPDPAWFVFVEQALLSPPNYP